MINISGDADSLVRLTVTNVLANLDDMRVVEPLAGRLNDKDYLVSRAALIPFAEGRMKHSMAIDPITNKFLHDKDETVRKNAIKALGKIGDARSLPAIIEMLDDPDWTVQEQAIWALKDIGNNQATQPLLRFLTHDVGYMRAEAAKALAKIGDRQVILPLQEALINEESEDVKKILLAAIRELTVSR